MAVSPLRIFRRAKLRGEPLAMVSLYDAPTAALCCEAGADLLLVGDSMGNVILGHDDTIPVTVEDMLRHTAAVSRGARGFEVPVIADLPFGGYASVDLAVRNGAELMRAGAHGLKLEGAGSGTLEAVRALAEMGAPVVGHLGYTPQSALQFEGALQGREEQEAARLLEEARRLEEAGCCAVVLEVVPSGLARRITGSVSISTIGIGAGPGCDGQVLVWHDLVGLTPGDPLRFVKRYAEARTLLTDATRGFVDEVHSGEFPQPEHGWQ